MNFIFYNRKIKNLTDRRFLKKALPSHFVKYNCQIVLFFNFINDYE